MRAPGRVLQRSHLRPSAVFETFPLLCLRNPGERRENIFKTRSKMGRRDAVVRSEALTRDNSAPRMHESFSDAFEGSR